MRFIMDSFQKEFVMGLFMDNDSISTINRITVAVANVINENYDNLNSHNGALRNKYGDVADVDASRDPITQSPESSKQYYENQVRKMSDEDYEATFKMKKTTVQVLIKYLKSFVQPGIISLGKKVHVFLMFLMSDLSYNDIGKIFDLHKSSVSYIFHEIGSHLAENRFNYISWPSEEEQHLTRIKVNSKFRIPNCVGFIDACRLKIGRKKKKPDTILLQAVCDESRLFLDVHIGSVGKTKKSKVFKDSSLSYELQNFIEFENHILGDSEYKLKINLISPFSSEEILTSEEMKFNESHWKARSYYIGQAFEMLKDKFCKLNRIELFKPELVNIFIYSACVLHNFILTHEGVVVKEENVIFDDGITINPDIVLTPIEKRQFLSNYINYIDSDCDTVASR